MPSYGQLEQEPWWGREIVTPETKAFGVELCRATGRPANAFGTKGDNLHMTGAHRSQEWILNSRFCGDRVYTIQAGLSTEQARHIAGIDFTPGSDAEMIAQCQRIYNAMRRGELDEVVEFYGNINGDRRVDGWHNVRDRDISADPSHLWHWHLTINRLRMRDTGFFARLLRIVLGAKHIEEAIALGQIMLAYDAATKQHWLCDGMRRRPVSNDEVNHLRYLRSKGAVSLWAGSPEAAADGINGDVWPNVSDILGLPVAGSVAPVIDYDQLAAALRRAGLATEEVVRDAVADLGEGGAAQVRGDAS